MLLTLKKITKYNRTYDFLIRIIQEFVQILYIFVVFGE
jgi:hypothetical protein